MTFHATLRLLLFAVALWLWAMYAWTDYGDGMAAVCLCILPPALVLLGALVVVERRTIVLDSISYRR